MSDEKSKTGYDKAVLRAGGQNNKRKGLFESFKLSTIQDVLTRDEKVIHVGRIHWGIFVPVIGYLVIALVVGILHHWFTGAFIVLLTTVPIVSKTILFFTTLLVLTNKRVFVKFGYFNKDLIQIRLSRLESAHLERPFVGQILGYATVVILGTGTGKIPVNYIANGQNFVNSMEDITLANEDSPIPEPRDDDAAG